MTSWGVLVMSVSKGGHVWWTNYWGSCLVTDEARDNTNLHKQDGGCILYYWLEGWRPSEARLGWLGWRHRREAMSDEISWSHTQDKNCVTIAKGIYVGRHAMAAKRGSQQNVIEGYKENGITRWQRLQRNGCMKRCQWFVLTTVHKRKNKYLNMLLHPFQIMMNIMPVGRMSNFSGRWISPFSSLLLPLI
jgi:hypothetical protein